MVKVRVGFVCHKSWEFEDLWHVVCIGSNEVIGVVVAWGKGEWEKMADND